MPDTYTIKLENFEGPMDLLLYLIKKHKIDIYNIPISFILEKYLNHLSLLEELNISIEGEFMEMAATLMQIKLRSLLPKIVQDDGEIEDPRTELVNNLLAYKKMKETAKILSNLEEENKRYFYPSLNKTLTRDLKKDAVTYNIEEEEGKVYNLIQAILQIGRAH
ncbi:MAG: segregation/condensation protein A, partial [Candidatus Cloacimonetes bacterium]|nr:segregation/condensation protein A [Candidatus Cloacimonadota bacterium]